MVIITDISIILICLIGLTKGASWLVDSAVSIAEKMGISQMVIGLTIVAFGTSAPEFGVTVLAALKGASDISVGNVVGSNIFNLGFILGGAALVKSLRTDKKLLYRDGAVLLSGTILLTLFLYNLRLSRIEGAMLFLLLLFYIALLFKNGKTPKPAPQSNSIYPPSKRIHLWTLLIFIAGLATILLSSHFLVESAVNLARIIGVSEWVIGVTIIAAGTSMPEFATSVIAAIRGHHGISIGNLIGSDIFNMFGVLGIAAIIRTLPIDISARSSLLMLIMMVVFVLLFIRTGWAISRKEGLFLVFIGLIRWVLDFLSN